MAKGRAELAREERLAEALGRCAGRLSKPEAPGFETFFRRFYDRIGAADLARFSPEDLYGAALAAWKFAARRRPGEALVRLYNPQVEAHGWSSPHTIAELVNDDMPFLVDSVTGALQRAGLHVHLVIHPILHARRDAKGKLQELAAAGEEGAVAESVMHVQLDQQTDPAALAELEARLRSVLADVRAAVEDWRAMRARLEETVADLARRADGEDAEEAAEARSFLAWLADDNFTFLGARDFTIDRSGKDDSLAVVEGSGLGVLRDPDRQVLVTPGSMRGLAPIVRQFLDQPGLLLITKTSVRGTVHRAVHMDYVGVKRFDDNGRVIGERRFVGLLTSASYSRSPREIPLLRRKVRQVLERADLDPASHDGKALTHILDAYPRDELFQIDLDALLEISTGILALQDRPQVRLFARRDQFSRYFSCLIFAPRERFDTNMRLKFEAILVRELNGRVSNFYTQVGESPLARIHYVIGTNPGDSPADPDYAAIEAKLAQAARLRADELREALLERHGEAEGNRLAQRWSAAFPTSYEETYDARQALADIEKLEGMRGDQALALNFYRLVEDAEHAVRLKVYHRGSAVALSECLPMLENMGLKVIGEQPFRTRLADGEEVWIQDLQMEQASGEALDLGRLKPLMEEAFARIFDGEVENDGFNRLVARAGLAWREVAALRAMAKYLRQAGAAFSQAYMEDALAAHPSIACSLVDLFRARFDPAASGDRTAASTAAVERIEAGLEQVASLDEDRILRRYLNLIQAMVRSNFYQRGAAGGPKPYLSFKLDSGRIDELPQPRPFREIWVYSPRVEAVHLRGGKVARGGIRWSDRREDFRTEVLGLMKAQMVKNAVIVPVGSKGGFVPKRLPASGEREAVLAEVVESYKTFMRGLLDLTDNLKGTELMPPPDVVRWDEDDPYLVVAADKGTATFSDIANGVAAEYGYWLGDAFASGGGAGYDHKAMGITARGAWEAVKRHFRELGRDVQSQDFTVVGVGDMSGDVFGNGMLMSKHIRLLAAFDHRDIFIDPAPDAARSYAERERLYKLPRSSWQDYDKSLISKGGGVFSRKAKSIALSPEMKALTGLAADAATPAELMRALLKAEADLLWNGGIGTYVKASGESHAQAGDRANDAIRVDGRELRCKAVGEGGNLGFTQRGRIEYALAGGRINTDAIDNSAGVDCSDHEVNIKVLLDAVCVEGELTLKQRNRLLSEMTDEVAALVLRDNYLQTQALSMLQARAPAQLESQMRFARELERAGRLDPALEFLPDRESVAERMTAGQGLMRPELAVLLAYAKMTLYQELVESDLIESEYLANDLLKYFPRPLRKKYGQAIMRHRLRAEIVATVEANSIVNRMGVTFVHETRAETGEPAGAVARAYALARDSFEMRPIWNAVEALDAKAPAELQTEILLATVDLLRRATLWFLRNLPQPIRIAPQLKTFQAGLSALRAAMPKVLGGREAEAYAARCAELERRGASAELAGRAAALQPLAAGLDIVQGAAAGGRSIEEVARAYFLVGDRLRLDWLRAAADGLGAADHWERQAVAAIVDDLYGQQRAFAGAALQAANGAGPDAAVEHWLEANRSVVARTVEAVDEFQQNGLDLAKLALANRGLRRLIAA
jgi:glutamate dehydrogenase